MIDLAAAELIEIRRAEESASGPHSSFATEVANLFFHMFPNARSIQDLSPAERRAWLNALRSRIRSRRLAPPVQPSLDFTGGVNEGQNT